MFTIAAKCSECGETSSRDKVLTVCTKCGGALLFQFDLAGVAEKVSKSVLEKRENTFWKFMELLPLSSPESMVSLGEPYTPMLQLSKGCGAAFKNLYFKDDGRLPTGTFKVRGMAVAVSKLKELGVKRVAIPSAGMVKGTWKNAETIAAGLRVPHLYASYLVFRAVKETRGMAVAVDDEEIVFSKRTFFKMGLYASRRSSLACVLSGIFLAAG